MRLAHDPDPLGGRAVLGVDLRGVVVGVAVLADDVAVVQHVVALRLNPATTRTPERLSDTSLSTPAMPSRTRR